MLPFDHYDLLNIEVQQKVASLTLNFPPANVLSSRMIAQIKDACIHLAGEDIAVLIITGQGNRIFCAGASINEQAANTLEANKAYFAELYGMLEMLANFKYPVLAAINGYAMGAGLELALCADIRIMSSNSTLAAAGVNIGLVFCTQRLPRLIGYGRAKELLFTARKVDPQEALRLGIVEYITPENMALTKAREIAQIISSKDSRNLQCVKASVNQGMDLILEEGVRLESKYLMEMFSSDNFHERIDRFLKNS